MYCHAYVKRVMQSQVVSKTSAIATDLPKTYKLGPFLWPSTPMTLLLLSVVHWPVSSPCVKSKATREIRLPLKHLVLVGVSSGWGLVFK